MPNDDPNNIDESDSTNSLGRIYVEDRPSLGGPKVNAVNIRQIWAKLNAYEYIRVSVRGQRPNGNQDDKGKVYGNIIGSRASDAYRWASEITIKWDGKTWVRTTSGGNNLIVPDNHTTIGNAP